MMTNDLESLWGGIVAQVQLDAAAHELTMMVEVNSGNPGIHHLVFSGVTEFLFYGESPDAWSYAELTEIRCHEEKDATVHTQITLWTEPWRFSIRSQRVLLDGETVAESETGNIR